MLRRLFILIPLAAITFGTANGTSESATDVNARMWRTLLDRNLRKDFKNLFPHEIVAGQYRPLEGRRPDINARATESDGMGMTPLLWVMHHYANGGGPVALDLVKFIIAMGADVNKQDEHGWYTPLNYAVDVGRQDLIDLLLAHGADPNFKNVLRRAVGIYRLPLIKNLVFVSSPKRIAEAREYAANRMMNEDPEIIKLIDEAVKEKASKEMAMPQGERSQSKERKEKEAQAQGQNIAALNKEMWNAIETKDWDAFRALFKFEFIPPVPEAGFRGKYERTGNQANEPDVNARMNGMTPLLHVVSHNFDERWAHMLIDFGADINAEDDSHRFTPLIQAAGNKEVAIVKLFLAHDANCNASPRNGEGTALDVAADSGNTEIVKLLVPCSSAKIVEAAVERARLEHQQTPVRAASVVQAILEARAAMPQVRAEQPQKEEKEEAAIEENEEEPGMPRPEPLPSVPGGPRINKEGE